VAVVLPGTLQEALHVVQLCADAGVAILYGLLIKNLSAFSPSVNRPQGANTGLTGGSVPRDEAGREFVIISTKVSCHFSSVLVFSHALVEFVHRFALLIGLRSVCREWWLCLATNTC
jgi:hypothetical protein